MTYSNGLKNDMWRDDPREYALARVEENGGHALAMLIAALKWMSHDDVRDMLDANELSPRFDEDEG